MTSTGGSVSPLSYMSRYLSQRSRAEGNFPAYCNPRFDHYLDLAGKETNFEKRMELIRKAEEIFVDDCPIWFANYSKGVMVYQPWVHGLEPVALDLAYQPMAAVWVDETSPRAK
jgi:peptide/nickel transport system substrate-binding protein